MPNIRPILFALGLALTASAGMATSEIQLTDEIAQKIRTTLTEQGYEVRKIDTEDGMYEVYALKDGKKYEVYLNADMEITAIKTDD